MAVHLTLKESGLALGMAASEAAIAFYCTVMSLFPSEANDSVARLLPEPAGSSQEDPATDLVLPGLQPVGSEANPPLRKSIFFHVFGAITVRQALRFKMGKWLGQSGTRNIKTVCHNHLAEHEAT